jgi:hypothetical protein
MGNSSGVRSLAFPVGQGVPRYLDIAGLEPSSGAPGDAIRIHGEGFAAGPTSEIRVLFEGPASAPLVSVTPTEMEIAVPAGALTGPVTLVTPDGRVVSPVPFVIPPTMALVPATGRLLTGQTASFSIVQSGAR